MGGQDRALEEEEEEVVDCQVEELQEWDQLGVWMISRAHSRATGPWTGLCRGSWARQTINTSRDSAETGVNCLKTLTFLPATKQCTPARNLLFIP